MMLSNVLSNWDNSALSLNTGRRNKNIYEFNLNILGLLYRLSKTNDGYIVLQDTFGLQFETVEVLRCHSFDEIATLASHVFLFFVPVNDEAEILSELKKPYNQTFYLDLPYVKIDEFEVAYWLLLNREASRDAVSAALAFGVSAELAEAVAGASDTQLRNLQVSRPLQFRLRYTESRIAASLDADTKAMAYLQRIQLSQGKV